MITRMTKIQLTIFAIITVVGAAFVGARYAQLDRLVVDRTFPVTVQLPESGGLFAGSDVTYRGVSIGRVGELKFNEQGVQAILDIEKSAPKIPDDVSATVINKSAVGEQFIDLKPERAGAPYLQSGSTVPMDKTQVPVDAATFVIHLRDLLSDVDPESLKTVVSEAGKAFENTGGALGEILDNTSLFLEEATANIGVTRQLITDASTVLNTQVASGTAIRSFSRDLALLSNTLVASDADIRRLIGPGSDAVAGINTVVAENSADLSAILASLNGITADLNQNKVGLEVVLLLYPYLVQGGLTVLTPHTEGGETVYNADFGFVGAAAGTSSTEPPVCYEGDYVPNRSHNDVSDYAVGAPNCTNMDPSMIPHRPEFTQYLPRPALSGGDALSWLLTVGTVTP